MKVLCPACGCHVTERVVNAEVIRLSKRTNKKQIERVAKLLESAEAWFNEDRARQSYHTLWRRDAHAIRYVFNRMIAMREPSKEPS